MIAFSKDNNSPCRACEKRQAGCHSTCQNYIKWAEEYQQKEKVAREARNKEFGMDTYWKRRAHEENKKRNCRR